MLFQQLHRVPSSERPAIYGKGHWRRAGNVHYSILYHTCGGRIAPRAVGFAHAVGYVSARPRRCTGACAIIPHLRWADRAGGEKAAGLAGYFLLAARVLVSCAYYTTARVYLLGKGFRKVAMRKKENEKLQNQEQKTRVRLPWICGKRLKKWGRIPVRTAKNGYKTDIFSLAHGQVLGIYRHKAQKGADRKFEFFVNDSCKI